MTCPLCRQRKAKRACPGVGMEICTVCCGTKRLTEIACPPTCIYLESAQRHPAAVVRKQQERDVGVLMEVLGPLSEPQLQLFFLMHTVIGRFKPSPASGAGGLWTGQPDSVAAQLSDADVAEATGALADTLETAGRGVLYEHQAPSVTGEALRRELKALVAEIAKGRASSFERDAAEVLRGIERGARHATPLMGHEPRAYLSLIARILHERPPELADRSTLILP